MSRAEGKSFLKMFEELKGEIIMPTSTNSGISPDDYNIDNSWAKVSYTGPYGPGSLDSTDTLSRSFTQLDISGIDEIKAGIAELLNRIPTQHSLSEAALNKLEEFVQDASVVMKDGNRTQLVIPTAVMLNAIRNLRSMIKVPCGTTGE